MNEILQFKLNYIKMMSQWGFILPKDWWYYGDKQKNGRVELVDLRRKYKKEIDTFFKINYIYEIDLNKKQFQYKIKS